MVIREGTYLVLFLFIIRAKNNSYNEKQLAQLGRATLETMWVVSSNLTLFLFTFKLHTKGENYERTIIYQT